MFDHKTTIPFLPTRIHSLRHGMFTNCLKAPGLMVITYNWVVASLASWLFNGRAFWCWEQPDFDCSQSQKLVGSIPFLLWMDQIHFAPRNETMVEIIICWYLQGNPPKPGCFGCFFVHPLKTTTNSETSAGSLRSPLRSKSKLAGGDRGVRVRLGGGMDARKLRRWSVWFWIFRRGVCGDFPTSTAIGLDL